MLLQTLVGIWPADRDGALPEEFGTRVHAWQRKAIRERKQHGTWADPDVAYEGVAIASSTALIGDAEFCAAMDRIVRSVARAAAVRGLSQVVLRCTCPGVPDLYQGTDRWDFSLVDPDNRAEVDIQARFDALRQTTSDADLLVAWPDGRVKQRLLQRLLVLRKRHPGVFTGTYLPCIVRGAAAADVVAYRRSGGDTHVIVVVPIRPAFASNEGLRLNPTFDELQCELPWKGIVHDALSGRVFESTGLIQMRELFDRWPVAVLVGPGEAGTLYIPEGWSPSCP
jgi:(1->4)-alpha-D-glucan 1-alpha-D-glucosylmutase